MRAVVLAERLGRLFAGISEIPNRRNREQLLDDLVALTEVLDKDSVVQFAPLIRQMRGERNKERQYHDNGSN